ncbi:Translation initiation factor IF-3 [Candidatus Tremblaya princeps]|uniref:Translation initiation factor IF-3 n=1 Tax=Tremblaya princeps TaxID=189385 RepID=A0A143WNN9_TREPR|nr:Translation initiation factor IF-3 [Candidatus Tremblaya princeps]
MALRGQQAGYANRPGRVPYVQCSPLPAARGEDVLGRVVTKRTSASGIGGRSCTQGLRHSPTIVRRQSPDAHGGFTKEGGHINTGRMTYRVNEDITAPMVRVIGLDGKPMGIMSTERALLTSRELGTDLVEVSPNGAPPVCRLMDAGKHKYQVAKRQHRMRSRQRVVHIKDIRLSICIGAEDYRIKVCKCIGILRAGDSVRAAVHFRGREMRHQGAGAQLLARIGADLAPHGIARGTVRREDRHMSITISPLSTLPPRDGQG